MRALLDDIRHLLRPNLRYDQLKQIAGQNGLRIKARRNLENDNISQFGFELFKGRSGKRLKSILFIPVRGIKGMIRVYDFHYFGDLGTSTTTVFEYYNKQVKYPAFHIKPKSYSFFKSLLENEHPVIQTTTPEFQEKYDIHTMDTFRLKEVLTEEFLDKLGDEGEWVVEGKDVALIYYKYKDQIPINVLMQRVERFAHLMYDLENGRSFIH